MILAACAAAGLNLHAQESSPPFTESEREGIYIANIAKRATAAVELLALADAGKSNKVHELIMSQYRSLRARDEAMDTMFKSLAKNSPGLETNRAAILGVLSKSLHDQFVASLDKELSAEQVELVKDKMTYNKVKVTLDAYNVILPNLSPQEKNRIRGLLIAAREEAMDGGTADEKSAIFQKHKDVINRLLGEHGFDVAKATQEWEAKQAANKPVENAPKAN